MPKQRCNERFYQGEMFQDKESKSKIIEKSFKRERKTGESDVYV